MAGPFVVEPERRFADWARLVVAWAATLGGLPYLHGRALIQSLLQGTPEKPWIAYTAAAVLAIIGLTWKMRAPFRGWGMLLGWLAANMAIVSLFAQPHMHFALFLILFALGTLWIAWIAWIGAWELSWPKRIAILGLFLLLAGLYHALIRVEGMTGELKIEFGWRFNHPAVTALAVGEAGSARADLTARPTDFPRFLGPDANATLPEGKLAREWVEPLRVVWKRPVGEAWSGFAIVGSAAITQEQRGDQECVTCYHLETGEPLWVHADTARYEGIGGPGPRATPTIVGGKVYAVGATGILNCLDGATGRKIWSVNILQDAKAENLLHGVCASPLVDDGRVIVCPTGAEGPTLAAYHAETGQPLWTAGTARSSYASPMLATYHDVPQILIATCDGVSGHDRATGQWLWHGDWENEEKINAAQPIPQAFGPDSLLISTGYGKGAALFRISKTEAGWKAEGPRWTSLAMKTKFTTPVLARGYVFGLDDGVLACIDPKTGKRRWKDGRYGHGQILLVGDRLLVQAENGSVVLVEVSADGLKERGRRPALTGKTWNNPAVAGRLLLIRNDHEAICAEMPAP